GAQLHALMLHPVHVVFELPAGILKLLVAALGIELLQRLVPSFEEGEAPARSQRERNQEQGGLPIADKSAVERLHQQDVEASLAVLVELVAGEDGAVDAAVP